MYNVYNVAKAHIRSMVMGTIVVLLIGFSCVSGINYKLGDLFFGKVPSLYNVQLAQFFYARAADPKIGMSYPFAYHQLSRTYFIQGNLPDALDLAYKELEMYPEHEATYYIIGLTLGFLNREEEAIDAFSKFIAFKPESWAARNDKAWLQFRIGDFEGALLTIEPMASNTSNPWVQNTYGTLLMNHKEYQRAEVAFMNARERVSVMTEDEWGRAYPGNDPRVYSVGLQAMKTSIDNNLVLLQELQGS